MHSAQGLLFWACPKPKWNECCPHQPTTNMSNRIHVGNIYHLWVIFMINVGKKIPYMDPMGIADLETVLITIWAESAFRTIGTLSWVVRFRQLILRKLIFVAMVDIEATNLHRYKPQQQNGSCMTTPESKNHTSSQFRESETWRAPWTLCRSM